MEEQTQNATPTRPQLLTILCILTFIGSGLSTFSYLVFSAYHSEMLDLMGIYYADMPELNYFINAPRTFFVFSFIFSATTLAGAILMWNLRKTGFHVYTVSQLISLALPYIYFSGDVNPMLNIMLTALFVYLYARNLQYMR